MWMSFVYVTCVCMYIKMIIFIQPMFMCTHVCVHACACACVYGCMSTFMLVCACAHACKYGSLYLTCMCRLWEKFQNVEPWPSNVPLPWTVKSLIHFKFTHWKRCDLGQAATQEGAMISPSICKYSIILAVFLLKFVLNIPFFSYFQFQNCSKFECKKTALTSVKFSFLFLFLILW